MSFIIHGEPGVPPAKEGSGELLAEEAPCQEQCDGVSAQALAQARGVVDGEVVELAVGIEAALEDEGMEMKVEAERVTECLIGDDRSGGYELGPPKSDRLIAGHDPAECGGKIKCAEKGIALHVAVGDDMGVTMTTPLHRGMPMAVESCVFTTKGFTSAPKEGKRDYVVFRAIDPHPVSPEQQQLKKIEKRSENSISMARVGRSRGASRPVPRRWGELRVELVDQGEDKPRELGEQMLVVAEKDPDGLGQSEDELPVGQGE